MTVAFAERKLFGGTCVNTGCMPTKTLVASAYAAHLARRAADFGVLLDGAVRVDMKRVKARADTVVMNARAGVERRLREMTGCIVVEGHARFEGPDRVRAGEELLMAPRIFVNVGGRAFVPDMPGVKEVPFLTNRSMLELDHLPEHLVVVGGSYVGLEFARLQPRRRRGGRREGAASHRARGRGSLKPLGRFWSARHQRAQGAECIDLRCMRAASRSRQLHRG